MNFVVLKNNLKEGLSNISGARKDVSNLPILKNFLIENQDGKLRLVSTDLEIAISHLVSAKVIEKGSVAIPYAIFSQIISNLSSERITIELKEKSLLITTDNYKAKISTAPKEEFPIIPEIKKETAHAFEFDLAYFIDSLSAVSSACQVSDLRPELSGVLFKFKNNEFRVAATDSFRLAEKKIEEKKFHTTTQEDVSCIIPLKTVQEVVRVFSSQNEKTLYVYIDEGQILFQTENTQIISRLIDGKFPDYEPIIPLSFETEVVLEKEGVVSALKLTSSLSNRLHEVGFITDEQLKNVQVLSSSQEFGESEYLLPAKIKGGSTKVTFNWRFVLDGLRNIKTQQIMIGFNGEEKPSLIKSPDDPSYFYIIMPIKSA